MQGNTDKKLGSSLLSWISLIHCRWYIYNTFSRLNKIILAQTHNKSQLIHFSSYRFLICFLLRFCWRRHISFAVSFKLFTTNQALYNMIYKWCFLNFVLLFGCCFMLTTGCLLFIYEGSDVVFTEQRNIFGKKAIHADYKGLKNKDTREKYRPKKKMGRELEIYRIGIMDIFF